MSISSFADLVTSVQDWLMRDDIPVPSLITLAEAQFNRQLRLRQMIKRSTATINEGYEGLPVDCLEIRRITLDGWPLRPCSPDQIAAFAASDTSASASIWYAVVGAQVQVAPVPVSGTLELVYYARLLPLSVTNTTNGLLDWAPDLYLYGCLLQAAPYIRDDARVQIWQSAYTAIVAQLTAEDAAAEHPGPMVMQAEGVSY